MKVITFEVTAFKDQSSKVISFLALYFQTEDSFEFLIISYQKDEGNVRIVLRKEHTCASGLENYVNSSTCSGTEPD